MLVEEQRQDFWKWPESIFINTAIDWKEGKVITAGVDVGSVSSQAVVLVDAEVYAFANTRTTADSPDSARKVMGMVLKETNMKVENIDYCIGTGYGRINVPMAQQTITEIACHARGASYMFGPAVRTVIDIGGQDCKVINVDEKGNVLNFIMNDKCAAGTGRGMEVFADLIKVPVWEIGSRSFLIGEEQPVINSTCVVFAKSEVIGLLEQGIHENDIMAAYCSSMAHRIIELVNRLVVQEKLVMTGGIAKNEGVVRRLEKEMKKKTIERMWWKKEMRDKIPFDTQLAGALGAAIFGLFMIETAKVKSVRQA